MASAEAQNSSDAREDARQSGDDSQSGPTGVGNFVFHDICVGFQKG